MSVYALHYGTIILINTTQQKSSSSPTCTLTANYEHISSLNALDAPPERPSIDIQILFSIFSVFGLRLVLLHQITGHGL